MYTISYKNHSRKAIINDLDYSKLLVIIPVYNEEKNIEKAINNLKKIGNVNFLIIDDCSTDNSLEIIRRNKWNYISNSENLKLSEVFREGVKYAVDHGYQYVVQFDGDGQHESSTIPEMLMYANKGYDIVIGSRYLSPDYKDIGISKKIAHKLLRFIFLCKTFQSISDPTCGLRLYNWQAMNLFLANDKLKPEPATIGYFIKKEKMKMKEIPTTIYVRENGHSYFANKKNVLKYMVGQILHLIFLPRKVNANE